MTTKTIKRETAEAVRPTGLTAALWKAHHAARIASMDGATTLTVKGEGTEIDVETAGIIGPVITAHCLRSAITAATAARRELARIDRGLEALEDEATAALAPDSTSEAA